jgi:hypothetical protein
MTPSPVLRMLCKGRAGTISAGYESEGGQYSDDNEEGRCHCMNYWRQTCAYGCVYIDSDQK